MSCDKSQPGWIEQQVSAQAKPLLAFLGESSRRVFTMAMFQIYASTLTSLMTELQALEKEIVVDWKRSSDPAAQQARVERVRAILIQAQNYSEILSLTSSTRQLARINARLAKAPISDAELAQLFTELRVRVGEDLHDRVFFCITDPIRIQRFFKAGTEADAQGFLIWRDVDEVFDPKVLERFPQTASDIAGACECFVFHCFPASVFHLMRIVECGVLAVARLADINDPKPSWGAVLGKLDKYAYRTEYKDLPVAVQPHVALIKTLLPTMHAIQHAWRNQTVIHVENKLIPTTLVDENVALEIMNAVQAFMRTLAVSLP